MRSQEEIIAKIKSYESGGDFFGFITSDLVGYLTFENAKPFLREGVSEDQWEPKDASDDAVKAAMLSYMDFAWDKANNCRGLSAGRSINHMQAWLWMLGEDDVAREIEDYEFYGKPQLRAICEHFGWDWGQWDDDCWCQGEDDDGSRAPPETIDLPFKIAV